MDIFARIDSLFEDEDPIIKLFKETSCRDKRVQLVMDNPDLKWNWNYLSLINFATKDLIRKTKHKPWNWHVLTYGKDIKIEFIMEFSEKPWDWSAVSRLPYTPLQFIEDNIQLPWNFQQLHFNRKLTKEFVKKYADEDWDWEYLYKRHGIGKVTKKRKCRG